jgi:hypothetical protein
VIYLSFRGGNLLVLFPLAVALGIFSVLLNGSSAYGQQSDNLANLFPSANPNSQQPIFGGEQQLIIIPSISGNDLSTVIEEPEGKEEIGGQGLIPQRTGADVIEEKREQAEDEPNKNSATEKESIQQEEEDKIEEIQKQQEDRQKKIDEKLEDTKSKISKAIEEGIGGQEELQEQNDDKNGKEAKDISTNNGVPIELPFP